MLNINLIQLPLKKENKIIHNITTSINTFSLPSDWAYTHIPTPFIPSIAYYQLILHTT